MSDPQVGEWLQVDPENGVVRSLIIPIGLPLKQAETTIQEIQAAMD